MSNDDHYSYRVIWSEEDGRYLGLCAELPSLSFSAEDQDLAFKGIRLLVADMLAERLSHNETEPQPPAVRKYSGQFLVRMPPELHRELALQAADSGISLNQLVRQRLSRNSQ